jgi:hypothetical protein
MQFKELKLADVDYERVLSGLFNGDAAATDPAAIAQPLNEEQVVTAVHRAREEVRSGHGEVMFRYASQCK